MDLSNLISNMGFPIAMVLYLLWKDSQSTQKHEEEIRGFIEAINNNTNVVQRLLDKLDALGVDTGDVK